MSDRLETATFGGGCFWCLEAAFLQLQGVERVVSGYAGGAVVNPSYEQVCSGTTGHAEVVQVTFDPGIITFDELLDVFFVIHDPTTLNRQGGDRGTQYRSVVFHHDAAQKAATEAAIARLTAEGVWDNPIVTEIAPLAEFYPAEPDHQRYFERNPEQGYCQVVVAPKVAKVRNRFRDKLRA